jgi:hypothetical protein
MNRKGSAAIVILIVLIILIVVGGAWYYKIYQSTLTQPVASTMIPEQTQFAIVGEGYDVIHPIAIPNQVLGTLKNDGDVMNCVSNGSGDAFSADWFEASEVALHDQNQADLVVVAQNGCLLGANIAPFWIFKNNGHAYDLVLTVHAHDLEIASATTMGYRDVVTLSATAIQVISSTYQFDGVEYKLATTTVEKMD